MAAGGFNIGAGRAVQLAIEDSEFVLLLLEVSESDAVLRDYDTLADLLGAAGNTELADGSYARKTGLSGTVTTDDANDRQEVSLPDQTFTGLDGNAVVKAVIGFSVGAGDANVVPITFHDASVDPDGSNVTVRMP